MKKQTKLAAVFLIIIAVMAFSACGAPEETGEEQVPYEIALISDTKSIEDGAFNEAVWDGIESFVEEDPVSYKHYMTTEDSTRAYLNAIEEASKGGARIVIAAGSAFSNAIERAQDQYPELHFLLLDGQPCEEDGTPSQCGDNTVSIQFSEEQAGYLAGYAAVKEGYRNLAFLGGKEQPPVQRFGYGYVQGAHAAAEELGASDLKVRYAYLDTFEESDKVEELAEDWYSDGTEVIFACAGAAGRSVMRAAEACGGNVIGADVDQSRESETVLVSAVKNIEAAVSDVLWEYYGDQEFAGGQSVLLDAENAGIGLSMESSRMKHFGKSEYEEVFQKLAKKTVVVKKDEVQNPEQMGTKRVEVQFVKELETD